MRFLPPHPAQVLVQCGRALDLESQTVCVAGMLLGTLESYRGRDLSKNVKLGSTLSNDEFANDRFPLRAIESALRPRGKRDAGTCV